RLLRLRADLLGVVEVLHSRRVDRRHAVLPAAAGGGGLERGGTGFQRLASGGGGVSGRLLGVSPGSLDGGVRLVQLLFGLSLSLLGVQLLLFQLFPRSSQLVDLYHFLLVRDVIQFQVGQSFRHLGGGGGQGLRSELCGFQVVALHVG